MKFPIALLTITVLISLNAQIANATNIKNTNLLKAIYNTWNIKTHEIVDTVVEERIIKVNGKEILEKKIESKDVYLKGNQDKVFFLFGSDENGEALIDSISSKKITLNNQEESNKIKENDLNRMKKIAENTNKSLRINKVCKKNVLKAH